jgi:hypothetical protein
MAIKLGTTTASLYLGSTPVAAYLGAEQVYSAVQAVTLYFNGAVDGDWTTVGNWWLDAGHAVAAGRLPAEIDSVVATASITASGQTVVDFTLNDPDANKELFGSLVVTGIATFNTSARNNTNATVTGNATFNDGAGNFGTIDGNATFNGGSGNYLSGTVTGDATFNGTSLSLGAVNGNVIDNR